MPTASDPVCNACKLDREKEYRPPRKLVRLPESVFAAKDFNKTDIPLYLCEYCDSDELEGAVKLHFKDEE